jgi:GR25 family glycosyltransferase involved in LPS biosynthesis
LGHPKELYNKRGKMRTKFYLINLEKDIAKLTWCKKIIGDMFDFEIFKAIVPKSRGEFPTVGIRGCFESHLALYKEIDKIKDDIDIAIIIEDDICFSPEFKDNFKSLIQQLINKDYDICHFYDVHQPDQDGPITFRESVTHNTHFYAVNPKSADKIYNKIKNYDVDIDHILHTKSKLKEINTISTTKTIVKQNRYFMSSVTAQGFRTDIQYSYDFIYPYDDLFKNECTIIGKWHFYKVNYKEEWTFNENGSISCKNTGGRWRIINGTLSITFDDPRYWESFPIKDGKVYTAMQGTSWDNREVYLVQDASTYKERGVKFFLINLEKDKEKLKWCKKVIGDRFEFEVFKGIIPDDAGSFPTIGMRGCHESHVKIWEKAKSLTDFNLVVIMEDDIVLSKNFDSQFKKALEVMKQQDFEVGLFYDCFRGEIPGDDIALLNSTSYNLHFYAVKPHTVQKCIDLVENSICDIDHTLRTGAIDKKIRMVSTSKNLVAQNRYFDSGITKNGYREENRSFSFIYPYDDLYSKKCDLLGKWYFRKINFRDTFEFKENGVVKCLAPGGRWKIVGNEIVITFENQQWKEYIYLLEGKTYTAMQGISWDKGDIIMTKIG